MKGRIRTTALALLAALPLASAPASRAFLVLTTITGEKDTLYMGDAGQMAYEAPLEVEFNAGITGAAGASVFCEWTVTRTYMDGDTQHTEDILKRQEEQTFYRFEEFGSFSVQFAWSYRAAGTTDIIEGDEQAPATFSIDASDIHIPNAFSPNGDGINDVFKVQVTSIVSFKMSIFNRWGKLMKTGTDANLEYEGDTNGGYYICWDGTFNGETVADGVYFINIEAVGAGGRRISRQRDINVLKGLGMSSPMNP